MTTSINDAMASLPLEFRSKMRYEIVITHPLPPVGFR